MRIPLTFALVLTSTSASMSQTPLKATPPDSLLAITGVFRAGRDRTIAIAPFKTPNGWMLLLANVQSDALRFLTKAGPASFTTGRETVSAAPVEWTLKALGSGSVVDSIAIMPAGAARPFVARRIPITTASIAFMNDSVRLAGVLYRPSAAHGRLPLIALAHGSEESDRYSFGPIPLVLAAHGFAVLAYDKRGTGTSTGNWSSAGLEELASDLVAGIRAVSLRPDIDTTRVAILGISEGGWVAPLAAARFPRVHAIAAISGGARTKGDAFIYKTRRQSEAAGLSAVAVDSAVHEADRLIAASVQRATQNAAATGFDRRVAYDPTEHWRRFKGPVLYMGGDADVLESGPDAAQWFERLSTETGNVDVTVRLWPRAHHSLLLGVTGDPSEFRTLRGIRQLAPGYWDVLLRWFTSHMQR